MFKIDPAELGNYLSKIITEKYHSSKEFCIKWLELTGEEENEITVSNKANKLSQIKKGNKMIQTYDLPAFSELLDVSFEEILSAGKVGRRYGRDRTNYIVAQSDDEEAWEEYINRENSPAFSCDEYGVTLLDCAVGFSNYRLIKYLLDGGYIYFAGDNPDNYILTFDGGASPRLNDPEVEKRNYRLTVNDLDGKLRRDDSLRIGTIPIAAANDDIEMLEKLHAREVTDLYFRAHYISLLHPDVDEKYDKDSVEAISRSSEKVLDYFTDPFEVRDHIRYKSGKRKKHTFIYPFSSELIDFMISNGSPFAGRAIEKMTNYNLSVLEKLEGMLTRSFEKDPGCRRYLAKHFVFYKDGNFVSYYDDYTGEGLITNIAHATRRSKSDDINKMINKLNDSFESIIKLTKGVKK